MLRALQTTLLFFIVPLLVQGQATLRGKVIDESRETVIGANVVMKSDLSQGTITDLDGNYSLRLPNVGTRVIIYSFIGLESQKITIAPKANEIIVENVVLSEKRQHPLGTCRQHLHKRG